MTCGAAYLSRTRRGGTHFASVSYTWRSFLTSFTNCVYTKYHYISYRFVYNHRLRLIFASRKIDDSRTANVISTSIHTQYNIITIIMIILYPPRRRAAPYSVIVILKTITRFWVLDRRRRFLSAFDSVWPHAAATPPKTHNEVFFAKLLWKMIFRFPPPPVTCDYTRPGTVRRLFLFPIISTHT